jgi:predicted glycosyl hydrolase (DUF1957 family)
LTKREQIMNFLHETVFDPILNSQTASEALKKGVRDTILRMNVHDAYGMRNYYWSAIIGTERNADFAVKMRQEGFTQFEEGIDDFRNQFNDDWLKTSD